MKNYNNSDYALNKINKESIVYRFADEIVEVTLEDFLAENPDKTSDDFYNLKALSDSDYYEQDRNDYNQTWKDKPLYDLEKLKKYAASPEDEMIDEITAQEEAERRQKQLEKVYLALDTLTEVQQRRYQMYKVDGLNERQIADLENKTQQAISKSLQAAENKIKIFLENYQK